MPKIHDKITPEDVWYILNNPWEITNYEWELHNESIKNNNFLIIEDNLKLAVEGGYYNIWKTANNEPIAILAAYKVANKQLESLFIASKHMEERALKLSFDMRQILKEQSFIFKGYTLGLYSESEHPKQLTWFRFLGFKYKPESNKDNARYFEYVSRVK